MNNLCEKMQDQIADLVSGVLPDQEVRILQQHLDQCPACRAYLESLKAEDQRLNGFFGVMQTDMDQRAEKALQGLREPATEQTTKTISQWRIIMNKRITKVASAAAVVAFIIGLAVIFSTSNGSKGILLADVIAAMRQEQWMHLKWRLGEISMEDPNITLYKGNIPIPIKQLQKEVTWKEGWVSVNPHRIIAIDGLDGVITFTEEEIRKNQIYDPKTNTIRTELTTPSSQQPPTSITELVPLLSKIIGEEKEGERIEYIDGVEEGKPVTIIKIYKTSDPNPNSTMVVDPQTSLPKKIEVRINTDPGKWFTMVFTFDYPETGPTDIYEAGAPKDAKVIVTKDTINQSLLQAVRKGNIEQVKSLISSGADVNARGVNGSTALNWAAEHDHKDIVELLMEKGADVNAKGENGSTVFHWAVEHSHKDVIELLIEKGPDVNAEDMWGNTPLHHAANKGDKEMVELLIAKGAKVNIKNQEGDTPLLLAQKKSYKELAELLYKHWAPIHDVAVTDISTSAFVMAEDTVPVVVKIANQGDYEETFNVTLTDGTNNLSIGSQSVTLSAAGEDGIDEIYDLTFNGETGGKQNFGDWLAVGDVNGDQYDDFLVSATQWNQAQGRAYLYYGGTNMDTIPDKTFTGENIGDQLGDNGVYLTDMNNDGFDDVILGARLFNNKGQVYIHWGGPDMDEKADMIIEAEAGVTGSSFGRGIATGDVNGDGVIDLIVSAPRYQNNKGRIYLYYGPIASDTTADKIFTGENTGDAFGAVLCARADVDGDGCNDLLIGTCYYPRSTNKGRAYLFYGAPGTAMDETCDSTFDAENAGDHFASGIDLFDVDSDGHADVIIGASRWPAGTFQGRVYLYWGSDRATMDNVADLYFDGEVGARASFGGGCVMGGYVNDDAYGDIIVAAYDYYRFSQHGRAYLYYGGTKTSMDAICDHTFTGEEAKCQPQRARIGDFNGDNYGDVIMGGYEYNNFQGRCWLWYGGPGSSTDITFDWDTAKASKGDHILKVEISPISGEKDTADNSITATVTVKAKN